MSPFTSLEIAKLHLRKWQTEESNFVLENEVLEKVRNAKVLKLTQQYQLREKMGFC
jgi:hypothetical protein